MNMDKTITISGYYRYTHILFAYPGTIQDPGEASAFKSFVHHTALGDPIHPLRVGNEKGLELYIGMRPQLSKLCLVSDLPLFTRNVTRGESALDVLVLTI